jgi:hypothetical protein
MRPKEIETKHKNKLQTIKWVIERALKTEDVNYFLGCCSEIERRAREVHADICIIRYPPINDNVCGEACQQYESDGDMD